MSRSWWGKFSLLVFLVVLSGVYVFPTLSQLDVENSKFPFKEKINLGLDLQGGLYLVLGVDFNKVYKDVVERQATSIEGRFKEKQIPFTRIKVVRDGLQQTIRAFKWTMLKRNVTRFISSSKKSFGLCGWPVKPPDTMS